MKEQIIEYKTAFLAREKGFDIHCDYRYVENEAKGQHNKDLINWKDYRVEECIDYNRDYAYKAVENLSDTYNEIFKNNDKDYYLSAPTQSLLQKWLREKHNIHIEVTPWLQEDGSNEGYGFIIYKTWKERIECELKLLKSNNQIQLKQTYEQALEKSLYESLKLIKNEKD